MKKKLVTIEDVLKSVDTLAHITAKGFERVEERLDDHEAIFKILNLRIDGIEGDVRDIKTTLGPLVRISAMQDKELSDLKHRVTRLEKMSR